MNISSGNLVSVIVPCYNQARFLSQALDSILRQTHRQFEIILINDGSTDETAEVAARYPEVRYFYQPNQGRSAARNLGARVSQGDYLVFLDADDALLPNALEDGLNCLRQHPEAGFVYGQYRLIAADGSPLPLSPPAVSDDEGYQAFLQQNSVGMLASAMFRRALYESVRGFDCNLHACEDYELYLRIARLYPVARHPHVVALYRQHEANTTLDSRLMLRTVLTVLSAQRLHVRGNDRHEEALRKGLTFAREVYGHRLMAEALRNLARVRTWPCALPAVILVLRYYPDGVLKGFFRRLKALFRGTWQSQPDTRP